jgi:hypothetical protein
MLKEMKKIMKEFVKENGKIFVSPHDIEEFEEKLNNLFGDHRYRLYMLSGNDNSGRFGYRNQKYYYYVMKHEDVGGFQITLEKVKG